MLCDSLNHFKSVVTHQFFVGPADNDYLIARWLLIQGFGPEFFWHSAQAIEKYLKAGLVLNGEAVRVNKDGGHDLGTLYEKHLATFSALAFQRFEKPAGINNDLWRSETVKMFLDRVNLIGSPDGRYGLISSWRHRDDLFKLDQVCWALRRLTIGLEWVIGDDFTVEDDVSQYSGVTYRQALERKPRLTSRGPFKDSAATFEVGKKREDLRHAWNFEFRRCQADIFQLAPMPVAPAIGPIANSYTSIFWRLLTEVDEKGDPRPLDPHVESGLRWMIDTIKLPKGVKEAFAAELDKPRPPKVIAVV